MVSGIWAYTLPPTALIGTGNDPADRAAVSVPSKAGASVTVPSAPCTPWTPSGRSSVVRARVTPEVSSSVFCAVSITVWGSPRSEADLEHAVAPSATAPATTSHDQRRIDMEVSLSQLRGHGPRAGDDRLGARRTASVAAADRLRQVDRRAARGGSARRRRPRPGEDQGVLALEEPVAADAAGGTALAGVLLERRHLDRARLGTGQ